jgi:iron complex outermembrane recepter protein
MGNRIRTTIENVLAITAISSVLVANAGERAVETYNLEIDRTSLRAALADFSQQTGLAVSLFERTSNDGYMMVGPLKGQYTAESALKQMISGSGLTYSRVNANTVAIVASSQPQFKKISEQSAQSLWAANDDGIKKTGVPPAANNRSSSSSLDRDVEEVIVTAQKRVERLQDVPISITVLGGNDLDKHTSEGVLETLGRVPGVVAPANFAGAGGAQLAVRGVSAGAAIFAGSSPIAYYLDSVPFGLVKTALTPDSNVYDLQRIEVLRGPQGTLYGASAQNGVVRVLTKDADLDEFEMKARGSLSTTEEGGENYRGDMAVNVPLVENKLAARAVVGYENLSGWIDKPNQENANDAELRNVRLKINGQATDQLSVGLLAWLSRFDYGAPSGSNDEHRRSSTLDESASSDYDVYGLKVGYEASSFSVTSMTSYLNYHSNFNVDELPFLGFPLILSSDLDADVLSQEITVNSSKEGPWRWSFGGIYRDAEDRVRQPLLSVDFTDESKSFAVFGQLTRIFLDGQFELTAGLRYFEDDVTQTENVRSSAAGPVNLIRDNDKFDAVSPRVVLNWHPASNLTFYASYAEGFRSGFNQYANVIRDAPEFPPLKSDTLTNYEVGAKGALAGGLFSYDAAIYYIDWDDVQQTLTVNSGGNLVTALVNGDSASGLGVEFALMARPIDRLELALSFSWNDLTADNSLATAGLSLYNEGDRLSFSSEYTASVSADYAFPVAGRYEAQFSASGNYFSNQTYRNSLGPGSVNVDEGESQILGRVSLSIDFPQSWTTTAFVDNVTNEDAHGPGLFSIPDWLQRVRPRTVGLQLEHRF